MQPNSTNKMLNYSDFFVTHLVLPDDLDQSVQTELAKLGSDWQDYGAARTKMYSPDPNGYCAKIRIVDHKVVSAKTNLDAAIQNYLDPNNLFDIKFHLRFFSIEEGSMLIGHYDNPSAVIIYQLTDANEIKFEDNGEEIFSAKYKFGLINSHIKHSVPLIEQDRLFFKVSISNYSYFQIREILRLSNRL